MRYTLLVASRSGSISAAKTGTPVWGRKECAPVFSYIEMDLPPESINWIQRECVCREGQLLFRGAPFDPADVPGGPELESDPELIRKDKELEFDLFGNHMAHSCLSLAATHVPGKWAGARRYWFDLLYPLKSVIGGKVIRAVSKGCYADLRESLMELGDSGWEAIDSLGDKDKQYLRWLSGNH